MGEDPTTVLVVDDDAVLRETMARALAKHGFTVMEAGDAFQARKALMGASGAVDLIIMDLVLPGLEGREAANLLLARAPGVQVLFTSGYTSHESARMGRLPPGHAFIRKPFSVPELIDAVQTALSGGDA